MTFLIACAASILILLLVAIALALFFPPSRPAELEAITGPFKTMDLRELPPVERYRARDGAELAYRRYLGAGELVATLIHGSSGSSPSMHRLALALQRETGATVLTLDMRGHGANLPHGDLGYEGQLDDDIADLLAALKPGFIGKHWHLLGFSSGGGFALRIAGGKSGGAFDSCLLLSPYLRYDAPMVRKTPRFPGHAVWCAISLPRIIGLSILEGFRIRALHFLPVLSFSAPENREFVTSAYSFRLMRSFGARSNFHQDIWNARPALSVMVGEEDELFYPEKFAELFQGRDGAVPVSVLPGMGHSDMVTHPTAIAAITRAVAELARSRR